MDAALPRARSIICRRPKTIKIVADTDCPVFEDKSKQDDKPWSTSKTGLISACHSTHNLNCEELYCGRRQYGKVEEEEEERKGLVGECL